MKKFFFLSILSIIILFSNSFALHPYHVGSMEFNYNSKSQTFEITGRFFMDDLENAVSEKYNQKVRFLDSNYANKMNELLRKYALDNLKMKVNNQFVSVNYLGYQEDQESVEVFLETEKVSNPKKVEASTSFLYNFFDDQMNIIHIIVNGQRKSGKLNYPDRYIYQPF